ncbi:MAG: AbrB/MazE/SpoVT family DNA-binding domain-containing protein [Gemmatimonadaceae bacterium]|nr:AbrB/MazE/SpoVT family DNA-binding domain-containing protein [Gemmatimonadaceae bacterium]
MIEESIILAVGNSSGTTIPKAMLERYRIVEGDRVFLFETAADVLFTPFDATFAEAMQLYDEGARQYRSAMRELAR